MHLSIERFFYNLTLMEVFIIMMIIMIGIVIITALLRIFQLVVYSCHTAAVLICRLPVAGAAASCWKRLSLSA